MDDRPLRLAFYGLAASELDLFTLVRQARRASLVLVVDPGPMAIARRIAEIAGVQSSRNPWDLAQADLDWIVAGKLARAPAAPLERAAQAGTRIIDIAEAKRRLSELEDTMAAAADFPETTPEERSELKAGAEEAKVAAEPQVEKEHERTAAGASGDGAEAALPKAEAQIGDEGRETTWEEPAEAARQQLSEAASLPPPAPPERAAAAPVDATGGFPHISLGEREDWVPPEFEFTPDPRIGARLAQVAPELPSEGVVPEGGGGESALSPRASEEAAEEPAAEEQAATKAKPAAPATSRPAATSSYLRPLDQETDTPQVIEWALDGMMSSVRSGWGVAFARTDGQTCLIERGVDVETERPELLDWLKGAVETGASDCGEPPGCGRVAFVPLKVESATAAVMVLGRDQGHDEFTQGDREWLQRVGERIASILCETIAPSLKAVAEPALEAPPGVWAAPLLERVAWARGWIREQFEASGCWLFAAGPESAEVQIVDEELGAASPPFLKRTIAEAMEGTEPRVWLECGEKRAEDRALIIQPLGPWGVRWLILLEGVPWRGDGKSTLARLKKTAATLARLLKNT